jgi:Arc/MetJ-type ribon-helix-helix transcriptional regulator
MSKITFRADDELIDELESFDDSKSEVMREALRQYLDRHDDADVETETDDVADEEPEAETIDALIEDRIDALVEERLDGVGVGRRQPQDVNVNITLDGATPEASATDETEQPARVTTAEDEPESSDEPRTCPQCGEDVEGDHVYCPNCGEKMSRRVFCECGDEIRSDWSFCPSCGRRTPAADVLDSP